MLVDEINATPTSRKKVEREDQRLMIFRRNKFHEFQNDLIEMHCV